MLLSFYIQKRGHEDEEHYLLGEQHIAIKLSNHGVHSIEIIILFE